jgi:hypothetical protein
VKNLKSRTVAITLIMIIAAFMIGYALSSDAAKPRIIQLPFGRIARMLYKIEAKLDNIDPQPGEATDLTGVNEKLDKIEGKLDAGPEVDLSGIETQLDDIEDTLASIESAITGIQSVLDEMVGEGEGPVLDY